MSLVTHPSTRPSWARRPLWSGVAASLLAVTMTAGGAAGSFASTSGSELDQSVESPTSYEHIWVHSNNEVAQTFTAAKTGLLTELEVSVSNTDHMLAEGLVEIQRVDADGYPTGMVIASATFAPNAPNGWLTLSFDTPTAVISGTKYAFVATTTTDSDMDPYNEDMFALAMTTDPYAGGELFESVAGDPYASVGRALLFHTYVLPRSAPDAPTDVIAVAGDGEATVSWTAPADHDSAITSYTATSSTGETCVSQTTSCTIEGLVNGTAYTFTVFASNAFGNSDFSLQSAEVVPVADYSSPVDGIVDDSDYANANSEVPASGAPELAMTGANSAGTASLAATLLGGGLAMLLVARRRRLQA